VLSGFVFFLVISDCPPGRKTDDAQGRCCVFPFTYEGKSYSSCTTVDHNRLWCSFDAVYNHQWANCGKKTLSRLELEKLLLYMYYPVISTRKLLMRENGINTNCTLAMTMFMLFVFSMKWNQLCLFTFYRCAVSVWSLVSIFYTHISYWHVTLVRILFLFVKSRDSCPYKNIFSRNYCGNY